MLINKNRGVYNPLAERVVHNCIRQTDEAGDDLSLDFKRKIKNAFHERSTTIVSYFSIIFPISFFVLFVLVFSLFYFFPLTIIAEY